MVTCGHFIDIIRGCRAIGLYVAPPYMNRTLYVHNYLNNFLEVIPSTIFVLVDVTFGSQPKYRPRSPHQAQGWWADRLSDGTPQPDRHDQPTSHDYQGLPGRLTRYEVGQGRPDDHVNAGQKGY